MFLDCYIFVVDLQCQIKSIYIDLKKCEYIYIYIYKRLDSLVCSLTSSSPCLCGSSVGFSRSASRFFSRSAFTWEVINGRGILQHTRVVVFRRLDLTLPSGAPGSPPRSSPGVAGFGRLRHIVCGRGQLTHHPTER